MKTENLRLEISDNVARVTLARADKLNALGFAVLTDLSEALREVIKAKDARALVLAAEGRAFCAGLDLSGGAPLSPEDPDKIMRDYFLPVFSLLNDLQIPTVSCVNGLAVGAGLSLALTCDLCIAARSAYFMAAFVNIGLVPDTGASWFIAHSVGRQRAAAMMLLGEKLTAEDAARDGLIWKCVDDNALAAETDAVAKKLGNGPTVAYQHIKLLNQKAPTNSYSEQVLLEAEYQRITRDTEDVREARAAFPEKRKPNFQGR